MESRSAPMFLQRSAANRMNVGFPPLTSPPSFSPGNLDGQFPPLTTPSNFSPDNLDGQILSNTPLPPFPATYASGSNFMSSYADKSTNFSFQSQPPAPLSGQIHVHRQLVTVERTTIYTQNRVGVQSLIGQQPIEIPPAFSLGNINGTTFDSSQVTRTELLTSVSSKERHFVHFQNQPSMRNPLSNRLFNQNPPVPVQKNLNSARLFNGRNQILPKQQRAPVENNPNSGNGATLFNQSPPPQPLEPVEKSPISGNAATAPLPASVCPPDGERRRRKSGYTRKNGETYGYRSLEYKKYGPYTCPRCQRVFDTSQKFASHMGSHYRAERKAEKEKEELKLKLLNKDRGWLAESSKRAGDRSRQTKKAKVDVEPHTEGAEADESGSGKAVKEEVPDGGIAIKEEPI